MFVPYEHKPYLRIRSDRSEEDITIQVVIKYCRVCGKKGRVSRMEEDMDKDYYCNSECREVGK